MDYKVTIQKYDENYNIHKFYKAETIEFYLEKVGFAHLYYIIGVKNDMELSQEYIQTFIDYAENEEFWHDNQII